MASSSRRQIVLALAVGAPIVAALGGLLAWAIHANATPGAPVGQLDLADPGATLRVDLAAGDRLHARIEAVFETGPGGNKVRARALDDELRRSTLELLVTPPGGAPVTARCAAFHGAGKEGPIRTTTIQKSMATECTFEARAPGPHDVRASGRWSAAVKVQTARVELSRERGGAAP